MFFTLLSVLAPLAAPSAWPTGAAGAAVGLMAETVKKKKKTHMKKQLALFDTS